jgi:hypothetical protein
LFKKTAFIKNIVEQLKWRAYRSKKRLKNLMALTGKLRPLRTL